MPLRPRHNRFEEHNEAEAFWDNLSGNKSAIPTPDLSKSPDLTGSAIPTPSIPNPTGTAIPTPSSWNDDPGYAKTSRAFRSPNNGQTFDSDSGGRSNSSPAGDDLINNTNTLDSTSTVPGGLNHTSSGDANSDSDSRGSESNRASGQTESDGGSEQSVNGPSALSEPDGSLEGDDGVPGDTARSGSPSDVPQRINGSAPQDDDGESAPDTGESEGPGDGASSGPSIPMPQPTVDPDGDSGGESMEDETSGMGSSGSEESSDGSGSTSPDSSDASSGDGDGSDPDSTGDGSKEGQKGSTDADSDKKNDSEGNQDSDGGSDSDGKKNGESESGDGNGKKSGSESGDPKSDKKKDDGRGSSDGNGSRERKNLGDRIKEAPGNAVHAVKDGAKNAVNNSVQAVKNAPKNAVNAAKNGVKNKANALKDQAIDKALGPLNEAKAQVERMKNLAKATAKRTKAIANRVKHGTMTLVHGVQALFSPPGLMAMALVVVMIVTLGCIQTLGPSIIDCDTSNKSNGGSDSSSSSSSSGNSTAPGDFKGEVATKVFDFLTNEIGFSGAGAAGALAVAYRESNFRLDAQNPGGGVAGIFQWSGFSNGKNGNRITSEGSIKAGDTSTLTLENQLKLLKYELSNGYRKARDTVGRATDPVQAAKDWSLYYEGVSLDDGQSKIDSITQWAGEACDAHNCHSVKADESKLGNNDAVNASSDSSSSSTTLKELFCGTNESGDGATNGAVNGSQQCDKGGCDFSWMCDAMNICHNGDYGVITPVAGYQCVWYAWTRAAMVHKGYGSSWSTVMGNGGDIWANANGRPGWTVDGTPKAGDLISMSGISSAGHVAFVEKVENSGGSWKIYISEGNVVAPYNGQWGGYRTRWMTQSEVSSVNGHFVRHESWK